ncbi:ABC transporter permease [Arachnia propionica]|uniref:ABC transporter permease n=1 Tax=Arachnia propionica TaxID=1750 RepID=A0A3P1TCT5_9ACTN|nr:ABC transporter permease [Arachnia propionica]MDO5081888.1 ABC transporter permease [Arachnia propionica]RRD07261.1 ABC transporter permease [Arachnia propionica]
MSTFLRLLGRRLLVLPLMVVGVTLLVFFVMSLSSADPARLALGESADAAALEAYREAHGLNRPLLVRFGDYLWRLVTPEIQLDPFNVTIDLGQSFTGVDIYEMVARAFPITLQLTFLGLTIAVVVAGILGVVAALYRDRWPDQVIRVFSIACLATPSFWLALLLIQWLGNIPGGAGVFPALVADWVSFFDDPARYIDQVTLPAIALGIPVAGSLTRVVRTAMVEELDRDYVRTAIGAGIPKHVVVARNVLRNALITPITVLGLRVGYLMGGAVVIELIFNIKGMGDLIFQGITRNDVNIVQGVTITVAVAFIFINIVVDLLYVLVNPRIRSV